MTFDDGYLDNYEYVLPLFDELRIPFAVYITNSFPEKTAFLWWYLLEDIILENDNIILSNGNRYVCRVREEKEHVFIKLRNFILQSNQDNFREKFINLFSNYKIDTSAYNDVLCLSWKNILEMSTSKYCTIGAHTMNHKTLNKLTNIELEYEIIHGKEFLEKKIGKNVKHFSYPFGTFNEIGMREIKFIKKCGFDTACYSFGGEITRRNIIKTLELSRKFFGELSY
jgi:peptidoglycan/xylan/chitin deacetylase (PgdA/CDA1 family)